MKHTVSLILILCMLFAFSSCGLFHKHSYGDWVTVKNATCTETGLKERTCSCGDKETLSIEPLGHNWKEATCLSPKTCLNCGATSGEPSTIHTTRQGTCTVCNRFINELSGEVDNLSSLVSDANLSVMMIQTHVDHIISKANYDEAMKYYKNYFVYYLNDIDFILNKYPNDFIEFRNKYSEMRGKIATLANSFNGGAYDDSKTLSAIASCFVEARPTLNGILGSYKLR